MTGYAASVWNNPEAAVLVVAPNWLGDGVMAMPALRRLRERLHPQARLEVLARRSQAGLWAMHPDVSRTWILDSRVRDLPREIRTLRGARATHAVLLPHSFRSGLLPFLAGVPRRRGTARGRPGLVNDPVDLSPARDRHQQWENALLLLGDDLPDTLPSPGIRPPESAVDEVLDWIADLPLPRLALVPGAARGPSKQWPAAHFLEVARAWQQETAGSTLWLGAPADRRLCDDLADACGPSSRALAGRTSLAQFTALLSIAGAVVANDSGGMHLAAAAGTPAVAVFGRTDPAKTGPLHPDAVVVRAAGPADRAVGRDDEAARRALASIEVDRVREPVLAIARRGG